VFQRCCRTVGETIGDVDAIGLTNKTSDDGSSVEERVPNVAITPPKKVVGDEDVARDMHVVLCYSFALLGEYTYLLYQHRH